MNHELITITTKRKIGKKKLDAIWDNIIDELGDNLETGGGKPITKRKHMLIWGIAHE